MSDRTRDKLIYMANQIANAFRGQERDGAIEATWDHLWHFWDPRMRAMIIDHCHGGGAGLNDIARAAVKLLDRRKDEPPSRNKATEFSEARDPDLLSDAG